LYSASDSRAASDGDFEGFVLFLFLNFIGKHSQGKCLNLRDHFLLALAVSEDSRKRADFGNPAPIVFAIQLNLKLVRFSPESS
jgi:hypothetical protein